MLVPFRECARETLTRALRNKINSIERADRAPYAGQLRAAQEQDDTWIAFAILKSALGEATFRDQVREALKPASTSVVPEAYRDVWRLGVKGVLSLNLDRLASRAHAEVNGQKHVTQFDGVRAAQHAHILKSPSGFVAQLHGSIDEADTWVLTSKEVRRLHDSPGYKELIAAVFATCTVVFLGITADDLGAGGLLERLTRAGVDTGSHYWITHRTDSATDRWAESSAGLQVIRYESKDGDHSALQLILDDLRQFVPTDEEAPPVRPTPIPGSREDLPSSSELEELDAETIRLFLTEAASEILEPGDAAAYDAYADFCKEYDSAIYRAWYITEQEPRNKLLGYTLKEKLAQGAFGQVYRAETADGEEVAVKVLREEIRHSLDLLGCFRRGVRSMEIMSKHKVAGMVPYRAAFEIPALVVMGLVDGPNLQEAVNAKKLRDWARILKVGSELTTIIRDAHRLPERVLHRDIRPANVMLEGFWSGADEWRVTVLDFDLSWHRNAIEVSILNPASASGYLAPEQLLRTPGTTTRHSSVDSFGIGMTLYFMCRGEDPMLGDHRANDWQERIASATRLVSTSAWQSIPARVARLIAICTRDDQSSRWDVAQVRGELLRLREAESSPERVGSAELVAEELMTRAGLADRATWHQDTLSAIIDLPSGTRIRVSGNESEGCVELQVQWTAGATEDRSRKGEWTNRAFQRASARLRKAGWTIDAASCEPRSGSIRASMTAPQALASLDATANSINDSTASFRF